MPTRDRSQFFRIMRRRLSKDELGGQVPEADCEQCDDFEGWPTLGFFICTLFVRHRKGGGFMPALKRSLQE
jgi:hypothetical protein